MNGAPTVHTAEANAVPNVYTVAAFLTLGMVACGGGTGPTPASAFGAAPSHASSGTSASESGGVAASAHASGTESPPAPGCGPALPTLPAPPPTEATSAGSCPPEMVSAGTVCIDRFEAPNVRGEPPLALQTASDGEAWCADRGKRLCTENEWVRACEGPDGKRFAYGRVHRDSVCNDGRPWREVHWSALAKWPSEETTDEAARLYQGEPSGTRPDCVSEEGVYDLIGNVAEWVRRSDAPPHPGYDHVLKGCYWAGCYHEPEPNCEFRNSAHPGSFRTYEAGFRCCMDRPK